MVRFTIGKKLGLGFGILLAFFIVIGLVSYHETRTVIRDIAEMAEKEEPKSAAAYEMEIHAIGTEIGVLNYLFNTDTKSRADMVKDDRAFKKVHKEYLRLAEISQEKTMGTEIDRIFEELKPVGESLMFARDYQKELFLKIAADFDKADTLFEQLVPALIDRNGPDEGGKLQLAIGMKTGLAEMGNWLGNYLRTRDRVYSERIAVKVSNFLNNLNKFESMGLTDREKALAGEIGDIFSNVHFLTSEIIGIEYAFDKYLSRFTNLRTRLHVVLHEGVKSLARSELWEAKQEGISAAKRAQVITITVIVMAAIFGISIVSFLTPYVTRSIGKLVSATERFGKGHLSERVVIKSNDEFGMLGASFNRMAEDLERYIAEKTEFQQSLRESEEKYSSLFLYSNDAILIHDFEGLILDTNERVRDLFLYSKPEVTSLKIEKLHPDEDVGKSQWAFEKIKRDGFVRFEIDFLRKDGQIFHGEVSSSVIEIGGNKVVQALIRDISERKKVEEEKKKLEGQLLQAQKMESVGTLAAGIAHDFNNLLMGIQGNASLMLLDENSHHSHYEKLKNIEHYVQSGAHLTKQLLGFARRGKYEVKPTNLNALINESSQMFGRTKKDIKLHRELQEDLWLAEVDQGQIEQALLNLYVNAKEAMPGGGELFFQTENVVLEETYVQPFGIPPGKYIKISITDTGTGMDEATQKRIFDPFFTTKEMGRGTGLGLASTYGIIKNHGGIINVYSEKGKGTTFNIYLPSSEKEIARFEKIQEKIIRGNETILLVDDEEMIIDVGKQLLDRLGYKVLIARSGREALDTYKDYKDEIELVILDLVMPDMGGGETYDKLKELNPDIKVLLASGYSINGQAQAILDRGCDAFIHKPFSLIELSQKIRAVLEKQLAAA